MSLKRIVLRDFVIVHALDLEFDNGFTVLTGETGAGKSILIDALQLVTGGRADVNLVREGCTKTEVCAEFDASPKQQAWLEEAGFDANDMLLLRRTVDNQGKSRAWINTSPATATQLRALGEQLLDIHGQHAWQSLTRPETVRALLDAYAKCSTAATAQAWHNWRTAQEQLTAANAAQTSLASERERLMWQISELEKLSPSADEWAALNAEHTRLSHAQSLIESAQHVMQTLDDSENSTLSSLTSCLDLLQKQEHLEPLFKSLADVLSSSLAQTQDAVHTLRSYLRKTELDPQRLGELDERMRLWLSLARRYKRHPEELPDLLTQWHQDLSALESAADVSRIEQTLAAAWRIYQTESHQLTQLRKATAPKLSHTITQAMQSLGMQGGVFEVSLQPTEQPMQHGMEEVSFLVAGHTGSTPRPIQKVASGGELSRLALAIAVTTSQLGDAQTLIFDEVDSGVGGAVAETVGRLMQQLGADRQVFAVTHLPQVAACADHHLVVQKQTQNTQTMSQVKNVSDEVRVAELARMLGGERLMSSTLAHARDLLQTQSEKP
ncbi:DNA repair protein RecN [Rhodoferax sp.]|uniref:DNA repair protein RecN n=2 Tax=Rhodoferax sp. TaxID=50421 RepID=UPI00263769F4|nr:DNA repair protein RecN [Rhodoferax sp.]MDD5479230.1 DNA repair protein RecN [Rhodoferax sp.]